MRYLRALVDQVPAMLAYWDRDLRCRVANRAYQTWFGVDPEQIVGRHIRELLGERLYKLNVPYIEGALRGEPQNFERAITGPDGKVRQSLASYLPDWRGDEVVGFFVLVTEVTALKESEAALRAEIVERQRAQAELQRRERELSEAQRLGRLGSWEWDPVADAVTWSDQLYRMVGREPSPRTMTYAEVSMMIPEPLRAERDEQVRRLVEHGEPINSERQIIRADGSVGWLWSRAEAVHDDSGRIVKVRGTVQDITDIKIIEAELTRSRNQLREVMAHLDQVRENERREIARELHDELGGLLAALRMDVSLLDAREADASARGRTLADMRDLIDQAFQVVRGVVTNLRPGALELGLVAALQWLAQDFAQRQDVSCEFEADCEDLQIDAQRAAALFRIVQESLTNIARHAQARTVSIELHRTAGGVQVRVRDDGRGFDVGSVLAQPGFGLIGMRERARAWGGTLTIETAPGRGTVIGVEFPLGGADPGSGPGAA